jgi:hypothetical protein
MKPSIPLHDARFNYIPAANHDADSTKFRERQRARIAAAAAERETREAAARQICNVSINDLGFHIYALPRKTA